MRIGRRDQSFKLRTLLAAPILRESQEKLLQRRIAIGGLVPQINAVLRRPRQQRHARPPRSAVVGPLFAERELAVQLGASHAELCVLVDNALRLLVELVAAFLRPPVLQIAMPVELPPFIVETVRDLVPHE